VGEKVIDRLQQGIAAARAGQREQARALLMQVVEGDERNEQAWLWLAGVVDAPEDMRTCLQNVLDLNPGNQQAQHGLAWVDQRYGPPVPPLAPPAPPLEPPLERELPAALALPPPAAPEQQRSYPGTTTKLADAAVTTEDGTGTRSSSPRESKGLPVAPIIAAPPEHPCPYCGMPTVLKQQACTQCRGDLMVRAAPASRRSLALTVLGLLWGIGGVLFLLVTVLVFFLFLWLRQSAQAATAAGSADALLLAIAVTLVLGMFYLIVARSLLARRLWAYITNMVLIVLNFFGTLSSIAFGTLLIGSLLAGLDGVRNAETVATTAGLIVVAVLGIAFVLLPIMLAFLSYGDFFGPKVRFQPLIEPADHLVHYNNGIAYKNRGMWYMATQEWDLAVSKKPHEPNYLHALGLAYAQLKQPAKARALLDRALLIEPNNLQIRASRALIDQMAAKK
jgi:tetratricopeptide (TPR) repeat protein